MFEERGLRVCPLCGGEGLEPRYRTAQALSVSSDCRVVHEGVRILQCLSCGHVGSVMENPQALKDLYQAYNLYAESEESDHMVFSPDLGAPKTRTELEMAILETLRLPEQGSYLDVGCNKGLMLKAFARRYPHWRVSGYEISDRYKERLRGVVQSGDFYTGALENLSDRFDLITIFHVLEHVSDPGDFLKQVARLLKPEGILMVQVPNVVENPFDLLIFDHLSHFLPQTLERILVRSGLSVRRVQRPSVPRELTVLCKPSQGSIAVEYRPEALCARLKEQSAWLEGFEAKAVELRRSRWLGVFGTGTGGTWAGGLLEGVVRFFVDESPWKVGQRHLGLLVIHPEKLTAGDDLLLAIPPQIAPFVERKWIGSGVRFHRCEPMTEKVTS